MKNICNRNEIILRGNSQLLTIFQIEERIDGYELQETSEYRVSSELLITKLKKDHA
jgi:hypothetical protein